MSTNSVKPAPGYIDRSRAKMLLEKWAPVLNYSSDKVAPLDGEHSRITTAILMENQEAWCLNEAAPSSGGSSSVFGSGATGSNLGSAITENGISNADYSGVRWIQAQLTGPDTGSVNVDLAAVAP